MSKSLKDAIRRQRARKNAAQGSLDDIKAFMGDAAASRAEELFNELIEELKAIGLQELRTIASTVKKGDKGDSVKGDKGDKGDPGKSIIGKRGKPGKDGVVKKGDRGLPGKDGREMSVNDLLRKLNSKDAGINITTVKGLETALKNLQINIRNQMQKQVAVKRQGGGGMTIDAGSNVTLTRNSNGRWTIAATSGGGSNLATEKLTPTQVGSDITLDLTALAHTSTGVLFVTRNGQVLLPNGSAALEGSSWSQSSSTVTVYNADDTDKYLVQYMFA